MSKAKSNWVKYENNPVFGGELGTCFDVSILREDGKFRMWFSWRPQKSIAITESINGIHWSQPMLVLCPNDDTDWENNINRPSIIKRNNEYLMWYTGQTNDHSWIGFAISNDGISWKRISNKPVLSPESSWENVAVMCPHVVWDEDMLVYRMWYSGGEQNEPNAIGYAISVDGLKWEKLPDNPILSADPKSEWEQHKVTACQIIKHDGWYLMFYIGFRDEEHAQIGLARSRDGITNWQKHQQNPIITPTENQWDSDATYKPFAIWYDNKWLLWYNGRRGDVEQIGVAIHEYYDLGF